MGISEEDWPRWNIHPALLQSSRRERSSWTAISSRVEQRKECWGERLQYGYLWGQICNTKEDKGPLGTKGVEEVSM